MLMMRGSPSVSGPTRQSASSGHAPSGIMTAFAHGWRCAGTAPARCLAERFTADGSASDDWRMREWQLFCPIGHQLREACYSPRMTCVEPLSPRERDAGADL